MLVFNNNVGQETRAAHAHFATRISRDDQAQLALGFRTLPGRRRGCASSKGCFRAGPMSPLSGLPVVRAAFLSHGYAVGYMTSPAARARFGLPRCKARPLT